MAWIEKKPNGYLVRWREPTGGRGAQFFTLDRDARGFKADVEAKISRGEWTSAEDRKMPFGEYLEGILGAASNLAESSRKDYWKLSRNHLLPGLGNLAIGDITPARLRKFFAGMEEAGVGAPTRLQVRRVLSKVLRQALRERLLPFNPLEGIPSPRIERREIAVLEPELVEALADAIHPRLRVTVLLAAYATLRASEIGGLRVPDLKLLERALEVGKSKTDAGRRRVALPAFLVEEIAAHLQAYPPTADGRIFSTTSGLPITALRLDKYWKKALKRTGIQARFHDLRHTSAALAIREGAHPKQIQVRMGHSNIRITMDTYGHLFPGMDVELADRLDEVRRRAQNGGKVVSIGG